MVHVPAAKPVTVLPITEHIAGVLLLKLTANPDVAVALTVVVPPITSVLDEKVMGPMVCV